MAHEVFRVDLADSAVDFQPVASEPGLPMLDSLGGNDSILSRWLGDLVAKPQWQPDGSVAYYVCHHDGGRLEDVACRPTCKDDLEGSLHDDVDGLAERIRRVRPESSNERLLHKIVRQTVDRLRSDPDANDAGCFFMKYRVGKDPWRLVWCWGYQRIDNRPATPVICRNPQCRLLFVHRHGTNALCPGCQGVVAKSRKRRRALTALSLVAMALGLVLLLTALTAHLFRSRDPELARSVNDARHLSSTETSNSERPEFQRRGQAASQVGSHDVFADIPATLDLAVDERREIQLPAADPTDIKVVSSDPNVFEVDSENNIFARNPGQAVLEISRGGRKRRVVVEVSPATFTSIRIVPAWNPHVGTQDDPVERQSDDRTIAPPDRTEEHSQPPRDPHINAGRDIDPRTDQVTPSIPVRLLSWRPLEAAADEFVPELELAVSETASYRLVDRDGTPLSLWQAGTPHTNLIIRCDASLIRSADGEYELIVERRTTGKPVKQFAVTFSLKES